MKRTSAAHRAAVRALYEAQRRERLRALKVEMEKRGWKRTPGGEWVKATKG